MLSAAFLFILAHTGLALWANNRFQHEERLPMSWWVTGEVTWSAPRLLALAFHPALAVVTFATLALLATKVPPRVGQEDMVLPAFVGLGMTLVAAQAFHLWLIAKTLSRNGS
jgi:hypothetical protein